MGRLGYYSKLSFQAPEEVIPKKIFASAKRGNCFNGSKLLWQLLWAQFGFQRSVVAFNWHSYKIFTGWIFGIYACWFVCHQLPALRPSYSEFSFKSFHKFRRSVLFFFFFFFVFFFFILTFPGSFLKFPVPFGALNKTFQSKLHVLSQQKSTSIFPLTV